MTIKKLTEALLSGKITEAANIAKELLIVRAIEKINELKAKKKFVIRGGKKIKKFVGKKGMSQKNGILTKTKGSDLIKKKKSARKAAKTGLKSKAKKVRNQKKSIRKRKSSGLK